MEQHGPALAQKVGMELLLRWEGELQIRAAGEAPDELSAASSGHRAENLCPFINFGTTRPKGTFLGWVSSPYHCSWLRHGVHSSGGSSSQAFVCINNTICQGWVFIFPNAS